MKWLISVVTENLHLATLQTYYSLTNKGGLLLQLSMTPAMETDELLHKQQL